ncbi:MAG: hypothetical protein IKV85_02145 [Ruminococcus sp.]|nr:hypothetical protein [Ruminococcus sp.]
MKFSRFFAVAAAMTMAFAMTACSDKNESSSGSSQNDHTLTPSLSPTEATEPVEAAADGPRLFIRDTTVKAGETAEVTIYIENAERQWNMCGFHITYPDVLDPVMMDEEERLVEKVLGDASKYNSGSIAMEWVNNKTDYLIDNKLGSIFFTEIFEKNRGLNGDVVTFFLEVPEDAASGTEYPVDFMYIDGDIFVNEAQDKSMEKYVFENWKGGKITVE